MSEQRENRGGARAGAGRKPAPAAKKRKRRVIYASDEEWAAMRDRCPDNVTLSEWLRDLAQAD